MVVLLFDRRFVDLMGNHTLCRRDGPLTQATDGLQTSPSFPVNLTIFLSLSQRVGSGVGGGRDVMIIINNDELFYNGVDFEF